MYQRPEPVPHGIVTYVKVNDLDKTLAKVEKQGGKIVMPKMSVKMVGSMTHILDSKGNTIALWEPEAVSGR